MDTGKLTVLYLQDFSNAFNIVDFDTLLSLLQSLIICPTVIGCFVWPANKNTTVGVRQGGVLSPLLL